MRNFATAIGYSEFMRGILLAGGSGTRLSPTTRAVNKHLLPIYDKPMIFYPLTTLILADVRDICIVSTTNGIQQFNQLMGDGTQWGLRFTYAVQDQPRGIADGIKIALESFMNKEPVLVALGDNVFHGQGLGRNISEVAKTAKCVIWTQEVNNPESFGIATLDDEGKIFSIIEKPKDEVGNLAITGLYYFPDSVYDIVQDLRISNRGEFEITEILNRYLNSGNLIHEKLSRGVYWLDAGTIENLFEASQFVHTVQSRQGNLIGSPEEAALRMNRIKESDFKKIVLSMPDSSYRNFLLDIKLVN